MNRRNYETLIQQANVLLSQQDAVGALEHFLKAIALAPDACEPLYGAARAYELRALHTEALTYYQQAAERDPDPVHALSRLGVYFAGQNNIDQALECFSQILSIDDSNLFARIAYNLIVPGLYQTQAEIQRYRTRFARGLDALLEDLKADPSLAARLLEPLSHRSNFFLGFHGQDELPLQRRYAELLMPAVATGFTPFVAPPHRPPKQRLRVGYVSGTFINHTVGRLAKAFVERHDPSRFEIFVYHLPRGFTDLTRSVKAHSDHFREVPAEALAHQAQGLVSLIRQDALDVLIFTDIGLEPLLTVVAAARCAPIQCAYWGHPITTGLPTMDYFLSARDMEPPDGASHYSEKLVLLDGIGTCYTRPTLPPRYGRAHFQLPEGRPVYLSCQFLYKYLPQHDWLFPAIAKRVPGSVIAFIRHARVPALTRLMVTRLHSAFQKEGMDFREHCVILPPLDHPEYLGVNLEADVFLDTLEWSGGNTTLEALACDLPVVTVPGRFMRGRHTYAMLKALELHECIASNEAEYVEIAARLGNDPVLRQRLREYIAKEVDQRIFEQKQVVTDLETFLEAVGRGGEVPEGLRG